MSSTSLPIALGSTSTSASLADCLGQRYNIQTSVGEKAFVLVKSSAQITSPARKLVASALDATTALPTWNVTTTTTAGLLPCLVISTDYTATIATATYFLAQIKGPAEVISAGAIVAFVSIGASTTAAKADDASITGGGIGYSLESASGADENVACILTG